MDMSVILRIGHPPRGRKPAPYGWPERLCDTVNACMVGFFIVGCTIEWWK